MIRRSALLAALAVAALGLPAEARSYSITPFCTWAAPEPGTMTIVGGAVAASTLETKVPMLTEIRCTVSNVPYGGVDTLGAVQSNGGAVSATAGIDTHFDTTLPVQICTEAFAIFGPISPVTLTFGPFCV